MTALQSVLEGWRLPGDFSHGRYPMTGEKTPEGYEVVALALGDFRLHVRTLARHQFGPKVIPASWDHSLQYVKENPRAQKENFLYVPGAHRQSLICEVGEMPVFTVYAGRPGLYLARDPESVSGPHVRVLMLAQKLVFPPF